MATQTMTEKDGFVAAFEREFEISTRVLREYPPSKLQLQPSDKMKTARELLWMMVSTQGVLIPVMTRDKLEPDPPASAPDTLDGILAAFKAAHQETRAVLDQMDPSAMNAMITMPIGPKQMGPVRRGDAMWMFLYDAIHHRGQITVYQRIAGGRVPSVYGPSADEPWW